MEVRVVGEKGLFFELRPFLALHRQKAAGIDEGGQRCRDLGAMKTAHCPLSLVGGRFFIITISGIHQFPP